MRTRTCLAVLAVLLASGCIFNGDDNGGTAPDPMVVIQGLIVSYGGSADLDSSWHSPTAEPGKEQWHIATILIVQTLVAQPNMKAVRDYASTEVGATLLLKVANAAACPVSKGILQAAGWTLVEYFVPDPPNGYIGRKYYVKKGDVIIGKPAE